MWLHHHTKYDPSCDTLSNLVGACRVGQNLYNVPIWVGILYDPK